MDHPTATLTSPADSVNTMEACRRHNNVAALFEMLSQPSKSERSKEIAIAYKKQEFGKRALLRL